MALHISPTSSSHQPDESTPVHQIEPTFKQILQLCIEEIRPKLKTKQQLAQLQDLLVDYATIQQLSTIIKNVLNLGISQPWAPNQAVSSYNRDQGKNILEEPEYISLQAVLQKHEQKLRNYIRNEQQLKLYCEQLEIRVKELEEAKHQVVLSTKKTILDLKRDNQQLIEKVKVMAINADANSHVRSTPHDHVRSTPHDHALVNPSLDRVIAIDNSSSLNNSQNNNLSSNGGHSNINANIISQNNRNSRKNLISNKNNGHLLGDSKDLQHSGKSKSSRRQSSISTHKNSYYRNQVGRGKIDQVNQIMEGIQANRNRKGSLSSMKVRDKDYGFS